MSVRCGPANSIRVSDDACAKTEIFIPYFNAYKSSAPTMTARTVRRKLFKKSRRRPSNRIPYRLLRSYADDDLRARVQRTERRFCIYYTQQTSASKIHTCAVFFAYKAQFQRGPEFFIVLWMPERSIEDDSIDYDACVCAWDWSTGWRERSADRRRAFASCRPRFCLGPFRPRRDTLRTDKVQPSFCLLRPRTLA